jgi:hypothetical protein
MNTMVNPFSLTSKDLEKLRFVQKSVIENTACSYDKEVCMQHLDSVLDPKCMMCRKSLAAEAEIEIVNDKKMHVKCRKRYKG